MYGMALLVEEGVHQLKNGRPAVSHAVFQGNEKTGAPTAGAFEMGPEPAHGKSVTRGARSQSHRSVAPVVEVQATSTPTGWHAHTTRPPHETTDSDPGWQRGLITAWVPCMDARRCALKGHSSDQQKRPGAGKRGATSW